MIKPLAHGLQIVRRAEIPEAGTVFTQSLITPPGLRLERGASGGRTAPAANATTFI